MDHDTRCDHCGESFVPTRKWQRFCSPACRFSWHHQKPNRTCEACGAPYYTPDPAQRTCGRICGHFFRYGRWPQCEVPQPSSVVDRLRQRIRRDMSRPHNGNGGLCSAPVVVCGCGCGSVSLAGYEIAARPGLRPTMCPACGNTGQRRRERMRSNRREAYDRWDIFERDDWTCQLCHEPLDRDAHHADRLAPTIDHRVPVSAGGADAPDNVQAAHRGCNSAKGDRIYLARVAAAS